MSEFLVVTSTFARAAAAGASRWCSGSLVALRRAVLRLQELAFGEPRGRDRAGQGLLRADVRHLALVLVAGIFLPPPLVAWFQHVARCWDERRWPARTIDGCRQPGRTRIGRGRASVGRATLAARDRALAGGRWTLLGLWGETATGAHGAARRRRRRDRRRSRSPARRALSFARPRCTRRRSGSSARSRDLYRPEPRRRCPTRGPGSTTASGMSASARRRPRRAQPRLRRSCPSEGEGCTRSRSARSMPASSSPAISASPPTARPWCGSRSGWATCTRVSRR